ncbi:LacI family DNA-binding transcriptional regulator [Loigolactobacillus zhaoyuanensis]|uniref:LacI family DNA-binding transcriptional regulator n=1 Tax=Loigolactobacillus zhaoyuanensis TaxID=2486017 RepID=A0ABW8U8E7_9LACO|nr:LacI family DNA-binding transcriptional regulator [Loigolactobacillus zhaoyuanensis]
MATLKDVAKMANVDVSTASRALNNKSYVHPETKKRILEAVEQLGYMPNLVAKSLRRGKRQTLGVIVPSVSISVFGDIVQGIETYAREDDYGVLVSNTMDDPEIEKDCLDRMRNGLVDGIIIAGTGENNRLIHDIRSENIAIFQIIRLQDEKIDSVVADFFDCGYKATYFLAQKGCKKIGFINGQSSISPYKERYQGYQKAIKRLGIKKHVVDAQFDSRKYFEDGYLSTKHLLEQLPDLDGLMVATDMQGLGAIRAIKNSGRQIPQDICLISLTGNSIGATLETALTSMEVPSIDIGKYTTKLVIEQIENAQQEEPRLQHIVFQSTLVERETT